MWRWAAVRARACLAVSALGLMLGGSGAGGAPTISESIQAASPQNEALVAKTVVSSKLRVIFFVGLEGTGHHFAVEVFRSAFQDHDDLEQIVACGLANGIYLPSTMASTASRYLERMNLLRTEMQRLAALERDLPSPGTFITVQRTNPAQDEGCGSIGELSYPNANGPDKALAYPDLQQLAQLAEEGGVDFRIMYLQRSAKALFLANTSHRHFQNYLLGPKVYDPTDDEKKFLKYAQIILADAAAIHSSLAELGPGFVICHYYDDIGDEEQAREIADFLSPNEVVAGYLREALLKDARRHNSTDEELPYANAFAVTERLQRKLSVIESQHCGRRA